MNSWESGAIKLFITRTLLKFRRDSPDLFAKGDYVPLEVTGAHKECCIAFKREWEGQLIVVITPRLTARIGFPPLGQLWADTGINWNAEDSLRDIFTGRELKSEAGIIPLAYALAEFPVAVLTVNRNR
jgi:(1->4)-alpha-D-glucan 1-alpha-D-glucosylmutase